MIPDLHRPPVLPASREALILPVDKPPTWTSFGIVKVLRGILGIRKIGHAGTLDPMATGLLICLAGRATKQQDTFMGLPKVYTGTLRLGGVTPSYDAETDVTDLVDASHIADRDLEAAVQAFLGPIDQTPPMYSAVKVGGERLYKKARRGETVARKTRRVTIEAFAITSRQGDDVSFRVSCSKGTYIRALAHDVGQHLGVGAYLTALRRTAIGACTVDEAWTLDQLRAAAGQPGPNAAESA
ncbi:MAG: tRNA pseudouridine(55) synthase TruB [Bacteroidota bacterium]